MPAAVARDTLSRARARDGGEKVCACHTLDPPCGPQLRIALNRPPRRVHRDTITDGWARYPPQRPASVDDGGPSDARRSGVKCDLPAEPIDNSALDSGRARNY